MPDFDKYRRAHIQTLTNRHDEQTWLETFPYISFEEDEKRLKWRLFRERKRMGEVKYQIDIISHNELRISKTNKTLYLYDSCKPAKTVEEREVRRTMLEERVIREMKPPPRPLQDGEDPVGGPRLARLLQKLII